MNGADLFVILALAAVAALAVAILVRRRKKGSDCCGTCEGCDACRKGKK